MVMPNPELAAQSDKLKDWQYDALRIVTSQRRYFTGRDVWLRIHTSDKPKTKGTVSSFLTNQTTYVSKRKRGSKWEFFATDAQRDAFSKLSRAKETQEKLRRAKEQTTNLTGWWD